MPLPRTIGPWIVIDSGRKSGAEHMGIDEFALNQLLTFPNTRPLLRFFQWSEPCVSYGYLMDVEHVGRWARAQGIETLVKRPSGGGTVHHAWTDLSLSLLWPRTLETLSDNPRTCYAQIHEALLQGLQTFTGPLEKPLSLHKKETGICDTPPQRFSVCFQEPVCNDVMMGNKKVIGGALRITKTAFLYQGAICINSTIDMDQLKICLSDALTPLLAPQTELASPL